MVIAGHGVSNLEAVAAYAAGYVVGGRRLLRDLLEFPESCRTGDDARCQLASVTLSLLGVWANLVCRPMEGH